MREDVLGSVFSVTGKTPLLREVWVGSRQRFFRCGYLSDAAGAISIPRPVGNGGLPFKTTGGADPPHIFAAAGGVVLGGEVFVLAEVPLFYQVWMGGTQVVDSLRRSISCADRAASTAGPAGNRGLPLISALSALPPNIPTRFLVYHIRSKRQISV